MCVHIWHVSKGQGTICVNWFSLSSHHEDPGVKYRSLGLATDVFALRVILGHFLDVQ